MTSMICSIRTRCKAGFVTYLCNMLARVAAVCLRGLVVTAFLCLLKQQKLSRWVLSGWIACFNPSSQLLVESSLLILVSCRSLFRVHVFMRRLCVYTHKCTYILIYMYIYIFVYVHIYTCTYPRKQVYTYICIYGHTCYINTHMCMHACMYVCTNIY